MAGIGGGKLGWAGLFVYGGDKMKNNSVNCSEKLQKLGNKNKMTDYNLQCINCGNNRDINLVAHRNSGKGITGFIVVCNNCFRLMEKSNQTIEMVIKTEEQKL